MMRIKIAVLAAGTTPTLEGVIRIMQTTRTQIT